MALFYKLVNHSTNLRMISIHLKLFLNNLPGLLIHPFVLPVAIAAEY